MPQFHLNLQFLSKINLSGGIAAALVAIFILVLADTRLQKHRLV